ncbi:MAG: glycosyltransferase, partial [Bacteroidales bacterium]
MRVILAGPAHPLRGGLAAFNERLAREFQKKGHEISLWSFSLQYPGLLFPGKTQYSTEPAPIDLHIESKINSINPLNWFKTGIELRRLKPDLLILRYWIPFMAPSLGTIARIARLNRHT